MYSLLRKLLFTLPPEVSHDVSLGGLKLTGGRGLRQCIAAQPTPLMGLELPNPVGLAAGLDKNGDYIDGLGALGFGFIEIGTITPRPQPGNPKPRLFRLEQHEAIINRMGFNNKGVDYLVNRVGQSDYKGVLGINIGKNKATPAEQAVDDYVHCMQKVYPHASYITVNLSSPNTPGLRDLQFGEPLKRLLDALKREQARLATEYRRYVPMAIKIAPDMAAQDIEDVASIFSKFEVDGVIATNTTIAREAVAGHPFANEAGGLSGKPLREPANLALKTLVAALPDNIPVIGVGGIHNGEAAAERVLSGATAVQVYTGFIYSGPKLIKDAVKAIGRASVAKPS